MTLEHVYRVTIRGRFADLDERSRARLAREVDEHDIFKSAYTAEGTFTYDKDIRFFNLRYEVRTSDGADKAGAMGLEEAKSFLRTLGYRFTSLKVNSVDTSAIWDGSRRRD